MNILTNQPDEMNLSFKNQGGATILKIIIIGKEDSDGWLIAQVDFEQDMFSACFKISVMVNDLYSFSDQLKPFQKALNGIAIFSNIEGNVQVTLSTDGLGHISIEGLLQHPNNPDLKLQFIIDSDQTLLPELILECNQILKHFPPK